MTITELIESWERQAKSFGESRLPTSRAEVVGINRCIRELKEWIGREECNGYLPIKEITDLPEAWSEAPRFTFVNGEWRRVQLASE